MSVPAPVRLGSYRLYRRIGRGGMAEVFVARRDDDLVDRDLVVKRMLPHLASDERFVQMFLREARIALQLSHPNIVQMYEVGVDRGEYFLAMELLEGLTARDLARRLWAHGEALPLDFVARMVCDAALGLHYAHTLQGPDGRPLRLVHRDVSADNLFVTRTATTRLLDFGIAASASGGRITRTGEIKGKARYMSPEQVHGMPLDARTDIYSLGVVLYWLLTGAYPFDGASELLVMSAVLEHEPPAPSALNDQVPAALDDLVSRMMARARDLRLASADVVYEALLPFAGASSSLRAAIAQIQRAAALPSTSAREQATELRPTGPATTARGHPAGGAQARATSPGAVFEDPTVLATSNDDIGASAERSAEATARATPTPRSDDDTVRGQPAPAPITGADTLRQQVALPPSDTEATARRRPASLVCAEGESGVFAEAVRTTTLAAESVVTVRTARPPGAAALDDPTRPEQATQVASETDQTMVLPVTEPSATAASWRRAVAAATGLASRGADVFRRLADPAIHRRVAVRAPPHVVWQTPDGVVLGYGSGTLELPVELVELVLVDGARRVRVRVAPEIVWPAPGPAR